MITQSQGDDMGLEFRATWDLNYLVFHPQEMAVAREAVRLTNLRDRVVDDVTRRFYERRRLMVENALSPVYDDMERMRRDLRQQELTADLDALTGGWFSVELKKERLSRLMPIRNWYANSIRLMVAVFLTQVHLGCRPTTEGPESDVAPPRVIEILPADPVLPVDGEFRLDFLSLCSRRTYPLTV